MMVYKLNTGDSVQLKIKARDSYSVNELEVEPGQQYRIWCDDDQFWRDWFVKTSPAGYTNVLANLIGQRVRNTKCFCLCAVYDRESGGFAIGKDHSFEIPPKNNAGSTSRTVSFFANDSKGFYFNNCGAIMINVLRLV